MTTTTRPLVLMYCDARTLVQAAADRVVELAQQAIAERGRFTWALSGGTTPRDLYVLLGEAPIDWQRVYFFWSDERCVPPEHNESNYGMLQTTLLKRANPPASNVHRMCGELQPEAAALAYEQLLHEFFEVPVGEPPPSFDLVLLGMGADGHTASLFPHTAALGESKRWVVANYVEALGAWRLTLTTTLINAASHVIFLVSGASKTARLKQALADMPQGEALPVQLIRSSRGELLWMIDHDAAAELEDRDRLAALPTELRADGD